MDSGLSAPPSPGMTLSGAVAPERARFDVPPPVFPPILRLYTTRRREVSNGDQGPVPEDAVWRLFPSRGSRGGHRTDACRPGHALRRIHAPLLAAGLLLGRPQKPAAARQDSRRGAGRVPRRERHGRPVGVALPAPRHLLGIRAGLPHRDPLLRPWLAVR